METASWVAGILGTLIAFVAYRNSISKREDIEHLVVQFRAAQKSSIEAKRLMKAYADKHDGWDFVDEGGMTYRAGYAAIEKACMETLNDDVIKKIVNLKPSKQIIQSNIDSVRKQFETYEYLRIKFQVLLDSQ